MRQITIYLLCSGLLSCGSDISVIDKTGEPSEEPCDSLVWYADADGDGYGGNDAVAECEQPEGYVANSDDCDDDNSAISPSGVEVCNEVDDDCNGLVDDEPTDPSLWYEDSDSDGYGNESSSIASCDQPEGYVENSEDCDDVNPENNLSCTPPVVDTVCDSQPYIGVGTNTGQPELHILSAYEPGSTDIRVHISRTEQMTVVLSSYDPANWIISVDPNTNIDRILLNGYHTQTAVAPNNIPVEVRSYDQTGSHFGNWCGYSLPYNGGGCDTDLLITGVVGFTGIDWTSFTGCYTASEFLLE